jgi:transcriptional regulator with XRE-family HTH domain
MAFDREDLRLLKKELGEKLRKYREARRISVEQIARNTGRHRTTIHKIEAGAVSSIDTFALLLSECNIQLREFLAGFRSKDVPRDQQDDHQKLAYILNSGFEAQAAAIRAALDGIHRDTADLVAARDARASPAPAKREGRREPAPLHTQEAQKKKAG